MSFIEEYFSEAKTIIDQIDRKPINKMVDLLCDVRESLGRLFFIGAGGGAANASHAVNDFRKIAGFEAYTPTDNVAELTARVNDDGWETVFVNWLRDSQLNAKDAVFVFSVGGGCIERNISVSIVRALQYAKEVGAKIMGVVGRDGGYVGKVADACVIIPPINSATVTPHTESFQGVVWHLLVAHPQLQKNDMKWESVK